MSIVYGRLMTFGVNESWVSPVGAKVVITHRGRSVGTGVVGPDDQFAVEVEPGVRGEIEIVVGTAGAAPAVAVVDGGDLEVTVVFNPGGAYY